MLQKLKIKKIIYTTDGGGVVVTKPERATSEHKSRAQRVTEEIIQKSKQGSKSKSIPDNPKKKEKRKKTKKSIRYYKQLNHYD